MSDNDPRCLVRLFLLAAPVRDSSMRRAMRHLGRKTNTQFPNEFSSKANIEKFFLKNSESPLLQYRGAELWQPWLFWKKDHETKEYEAYKRETDAIKNADKYMNRTNHHAG